MYSILVVVVNLLILIPFIYWYFTRNFNYWIKRGISGPKPSFGFGNILLPRWKPFSVLDTEFDRKYGKIYGMFCGQMPVLVVNDPELIKMILVKDFQVFRNRRSFGTTHEILDKAVLYARDGEWKRLRSLTTFVFTASKLKRMTPLILECVDDMTEALHEYSVNEKDINLKDLCGSYTMDVIAKCAFATKFNVYKDQNNPFIRSAKNIFHPTLIKILVCFLLPKFLLNLFNIRSMFDEKSNEFIFDLSRNLLNDRRNGNKVHNDLLQLLIDTKKDDKNNSENKKGLTDNEILAQSWLFLLAGYETTSTGITFCFYELALNTDIQEELFEEIQTALDSSGHFDYEKLWNLELLDAVIAETLRLYPPFLRLEREVKSDYELGDTGITLNAGQLVHISIYAVHHSERYFPEPEKFDPNRFMPQNKDKIIPYTYLPFAVGPRNCVAMRLALMEMKTCIAHVVNKFRLTANPRTHIPPKFLTTTHLCSAQPLLVTIKNR